MLSITIKETIRLAVLRIIVVTSMVAFVLGAAIVQKEKASLPAETLSDQVLIAAVLPATGIELPIQWNDLGNQLIEEGVIDAEKLEALYEPRGGLGREERELLYGTKNGSLRMTPENANFLLNLFWAFGLANKNEILEQGPMQDPRYGGAGPPAGGFASTGGWALAKGDAMEHYSAHALIRLTPAQQALVEKTSKNIYRPCCGNSTFFPDCNHGMAMLGLLELLAAQGVSEHDMYRIALQVNSYWFPDTYATLAKYFAGKGIFWNQVDPQTVLGYDFSSYAGYSQILSQVTPPNLQRGGSCGV